MHAVLYRKNDPQIPLPVDVFQQEFSTKRGQAETARFREEIRREKVGAKKSAKLSPNCAAIVDNSNCALLDLEQTVLCSAGRRKAQKGMCWIDENAMP